MTDAFHPKKVEFNLSILHTRFRRSVLQNFDFFLYRAYILKKNHFTSLEIITKDTTHAYHLYLLLIILKCENVKTASNNSRNKNKLIQKEDNKI